MSYKSINEKYSKILQEDIDRRNKETDIEMNEVSDATKKKSQDDYKKKSAEIDKIIQSIQKKLKTHSKRFVIGEKRDWGYVGDLGRILNDLKNIDDYIRY